MAREITLWLAQDKDTVDEWCYVYQAEPTWNGRYWVSLRGSIGGLDRKAVCKCLGRDIRPGEKVKLTVTVGRRQKARKK